MSEFLINIILLIITLIYILICFTKNISSFIFLVFLIFILTSATLFIMGLKFVSVLYLIIYAGAVIILFIISTKSIEISQNIKTSFKNIPLLVSSIVFITVLAMMILKTKTFQDTVLSYYRFSIVDIMFNKNFIAVEILSLILIAAIAGIISFLKEKKDEI
ncbi:MAG: NADH-quinone oxidoreductase subunit J [Elusimicrobiales bacterium]